MNTDEAKQTIAAAPERKRLQMTKGDWERVEAANRRSEAKPDELQITVFIDAPKPTRKAK